MILQRILEATEARLGAVAPIDALREAAAARAPALGFAAAMREDGLQIVAEIKRRSPSAGAISTGLDPGALAAEYVAGGAAAVSVLTEPHFFGGSIDDLEAVRAHVVIPILRKDFIIDASQIWEARAAGADAVLLIVAALGPDQLEDLVGAAGEAGIAALVEVHTEAEALVALQAGAEVIGVNNRDLGTFVTDLAVAEAIAASLPADGVRIAESGVANAAGAARMAAAGYDGILVGEALVRAPDPAGLVAELRSAS